MDQDHGHLLHHVAEHNTVTPSSVSLFDNHTSTPFADLSFLNDVSDSSMGHDDHSHHSNNHQHSEIDQAISYIDIDHRSAPAHGQHSGASSMDHSMMAMWFHFGYVETILFSFWKIDSITGLIGSMVGIFLMSMLYEGLIVFREYLLQRSLQFQGVALGGTASPVRLRPVRTTVSEYPWPVKAIR
uniref:Copper transport protein n=1 Tax=Romanomermis culicivorax TaxID=13658 RepID=A0A915I614_ROMCU